MSMQDMYSEYKSLCRKVFQFTWVAICHHDGVMLRVPDSDRTVTASDRKDGLGLLAIQAVQEGLLVDVQPETCSLTLRNTVDGPCVHMQLDSRSVVCLQ